MGLMRPIEAIETKAVLVPNCGNDKLESWRSTKHVIREKKRSCHVWGLFAIEDAGAYGKTESSDAIGSSIGTGGGFH